MKSRLVAAALVATLVFAASSYAGTVTISAVNNSAGAGDSQKSTTGFVTNDILLNAGAGQTISSQQLLITTAAGQIYQHPFANNTSPGYGTPGNALAGAFPGILFDTYTAAGTASTGATTAPAPTMAGKSQTLGGPGGAGAAIQTDASMDSSWGGGATIANYLSARITLAATLLTGTWKYQANFLESDGITTTPVVISNGVIAAGVMLTSGAVVPEPATLSMLGLAMVGGLGLVRRRR